MFKKLLSDNRIFGALVCALVFIAAGLLYLNRVKSQSERAVQRTQETVKQIETPKTEGQTPKGGHWHGDVWHAEPHETPDPIETAAPGGINTSASAETAASTILDRPGKQTNPSEEVPSKTESQQSIVGNLPALPRLPPAPESPEELLARNTWHDALVVESEKVGAMPRGTESEREAYRAALEVYLEKARAFISYMDEINRKYEDRRVISEEHIRILEHHRAQQQQQASEAQGDRR